jgi:hypothetical protein
MSVAKNVLIADLQEVAKKTDVVTRDYYRGTGKYADKIWQKHFSKFEDFCSAAGVNQPSTVNEINGNSWNVFIPSTTLCSADDVIKYCKVDLSIWELDRFRAKDVSKDDEQKFQISAFFKKRKNIIEIQKEIQALKSLAESHSIEPDKEYDYSSDSGNMLEINIPDVHFGKLAWPEETGYEPYDVKIASAMYQRAVRALIDRTKGTKYDQVLYVIGNDMLNADDLEGRTTSGTQVTNDVRYHKVFSVVRTTVIWAVEELRKIAPVKVVVVPGNHDQLSSWHLGDSVQCYFHAYKDVIVENSPRQRKYHEFGTVMLGFTHGDKGSLEDYPLLMATEQPEMFGRTKFREMHTGHTHRTKLDEKHGVRVRVLPALCPADDWHSENSYVGNLRNAEAYTWNQREGLTGITIFNDNSQVLIASEVVLK